MIVLFLIPIAIVTAIVLLATKKSPESFETKIRSIYCYIILLGSLIGIIIGSILFLHTGIDLLFPTTTSDVYYSKPTLNVVSSTAKLSSDDIEILRSRNEKLQKAIMSLGTVLVSVPVFLFHKKLLEGNKK